MSSLRKGLVLVNNKLSKKGVVIDWGRMGGIKHRPYMLDSKEAADAVRVWTGNRIEVWPLAEVAEDARLSTAN